MWLLSVAVLLFLKQIQPLNATAGGHVFVLRRQARRFFLFSCLQLYLTLLCSVPCHSAPLSAICRQWRGPLMQQLDNDMPCTEYGVRSMEYGVWHIVKLPRRSKKERPRGSQQVSLCLCNMGSVRSTVCAQRCVQRCAKTCPLSLPTAWETRE